MPKRCLICSSEAQFAVKGTSDFYCGTCAEEHFGDIALLVAIEEQAKQMKEAVDGAAEDFRIDDLEENPGA